MQNNEVTLRICVVVSIHRITSDRFDKVIIYKSYYSC